MVTLPKGIFEVLEEAFKRQKDGENLTDKINYLFKIYGPSNGPWMANKTKKKHQTDGPDLNNLTEDRNKQPLNKS